MPLKALNLLLLGRRQTLSPQTTPLYQSDCGQGVDNMLFVIHALST